MTEDPTFSPGQNPSDPGEAPDDVEQALVRIEKLVASVERKQRGSPDDTEKLARARAAIERLSSRIGKAETRAVEQKYASVKRSEMTLAEKTRAIEQLGSHGYLALPE